MLRVSECRVKLAGDRDPGRDGHLKAYASIVVDEALAIKDLKVIESDDGRLIVAMPSRKSCAHCPGCGRKNVVLAWWCNFCRRRLPEPQPARDRRGKPALFADVLHPITAECRRVITEAVVGAYLDAVAAAARAEYVAAIDAA